MIITNLYSSRVTGDGAWIVTWFIGLLSINEHLYVNLLVEVTMLTIRVPLLYVRFHQGSFS